MKFQGHMDQQACLFGEVCWTSRFYWSSLERQNGELLTNESVTPPTLSKVQKHLLLKVGEFFSSFCFSCILTEELQAVRLKKSRKETPRTSTSNHLHWGLKRSHLNVCTHIWPTQPTLGICLLPLYNLNDCMFFCCLDCLCLYFGHSASCQ